ncbi:hypothetical protein LZC95_35590 [Pendulispora brunnea]|uniref:Uncharacterized protein n=1 Tax=Pendulispora brunnea TaxID=2905690 RepID=A0ABZ2K3J7_9BACT
MSLSAGVWQGAEVLHGLLVVKEPSDRDSDARNRRAVAHALHQIGGLSAWFAGSISSMCGLSCAGRLLASPRLRGAVS